MWGCWLCITRASGELFRMEPTERTMRPNHTIVLPPGLKEALCLLESQGELRNPQPGFAQILTDAIITPQAGSRFQGGEVKSKTAERLSTRRRRPARRRPRHWGRASTTGGPRKGQKKEGAETLENRWGGTLHRGSMAAAFALVADMERTVPSLTRMYKTVQEPAGVVDSDGNHPTAFRRNYEAI